MKGSYILYIKLSRPGVYTIGKLGAIQFEKGFYAYVGSAMSGIEQRVARHMRKEKKLHWHIDYLLENSEVMNVKSIESIKKIECEIAKKYAARFICIPGFGCSDCKCESHLFYSPDIDYLMNYIVP